MNLKYTYADKYFLFLSSNVLTLFFRDESGSLKMLIKEIPVITFSTTNNFSGKTPVLTKKNIRKIQNTKENLKSRKSDKYLTNQKLDFIN